MLYKQLKFRQMSNYIILDIYLFAWWKWLQLLSGCGRCQPSFSIHVISTIFLSLLPLFKAVKLCLAMAIIPVDTQVSEFCRDHDGASLDTQLRIDSLWDRLRPIWQLGTQWNTAKGKLQLLGNDKSGQRESSARASSPPPPPPLNRDWVPLTA